MLKDTFSRKLSTLDTIIVTQEFSTFCEIV